MTSSGKVPSQNAASARLPCTADPVPAAAATNAYSQPHGSSAEHSPMAPARMFAGHARTWPSARL
jgi:hypothetical protein